MSVRLEAIGQRLCLVTAGLGVFVLVAWVMGAPELATMVSGQPPMMPNTAVGLTMIGVAGALRRIPVRGPRRLLSNLLALTVLALGVATSAEYVLGTDLGIDRLLLATTYGPTPGRMSPPTAVALALLGAAVLVYDLPPRLHVRPAEGFAVAAALVALTSLLGQLFGEGPLYSPSHAPVIGVAVPTSVGLLAAAMGLVFQRSDWGTMRLASSAGPGGLLFRRLVPAAVLAPVLLGLVLSRVLSVLGMEDLPLVYATLSVAWTAAGIALLAANAVPLDRMHDALELNRQELLRDNIERRKVESALRASEAKLSGIIALSNDAIVAVDADQRITMFNASAERIFGYRLEEVLGADLGILIPERLRARHREHVAAFSAEPVTARSVDARSVDLVALRKNGEEFPIEAAISKLQLDTGPCFTVTLRDVTEQRRTTTEKELLADIGSVLSTTLDLERTLQTVGDLAVRNLADICMIDVAARDGDLQRAHVVSRDPSISGACDEILRVALAHECPYLSRATFEAKRTVLVEQLSPEMLDAFARLPEHLALLRAIRPRSVIATPLLAQDEVLGMMVVVSSDPSPTYGPRDVALVEEIARRLGLWLDNVRLYRTARSATRARDEVIGVVAHDLRNPLNVVLMQAALLRESVSAARGPAERIDRSVQRMNRLIQDLLDVSRLDTGAFAIARARHPARQLVAEVLETQRALASAAAIELSLDAPDELPHVSADRDRLQQVFENLVGNAIKFTPRGGHVGIGASARDRDVLFWVSDTGIGIGPEDLPHVFERFWQARSEDRQRGAGLGLTIAKAIVEAHGGRIWVESAPGQGTTFFFAIPQSAPAEAREAAATAPSSP